MLRIRDRLLPLSAIYTTVGITTFVVTLGGLLLVRPDFAPSQSSAIDTSQQEKLPEVTTVSTKESKPKSEVSEEVPAVPTPSQTPYYQQTNWNTNSTAATPKQTTSTPQPTPTLTPTPQVAPTATEQTSQTSASLEPTSEVESNPSLLGGLLGVVDAIL